MSRWRERARVAAQSLRVQLLVGLLIPLAAITLINLSLARHNAREMADLILDRSLFVSASAIAEHVQAQGDRFDVYIPPFALGEWSPANDITYYRVDGANGELLAGYSDVPVLLNRSDEAGPRYDEVLFHGARVRFVALRKVVFSGHTARSAYVVVGETLHARDGMVRTLQLQAAEQQGLLVVIAAILAFFVLRRNFAPLIRLGQEVRERRPGDLASLTTGIVQRELQPFVTALNDMLDRQRQQLQAQRRFAANAAHQLRTPLALLGVQADYALSESDIDRRADAIHAFKSTTNRMTRITKQLLRLSEAESQLPAARRKPIDMIALARDVLEGHAGLALTRDIDLGFEAATIKPVVTVGDPQMLREVMLNLIGNALQYVPAGGVVTVAVAGDDDTCVLRVEDDGPGIPVAERELVFERFYRVLGTSAEGSGLGLSIVKEIVESSGGTVSLADPASGSGLVVIVRLPQYLGEPAALGIQLR